MKTKIIKCYCLRTKRGNLICPLTTEKSDLEHTFNYAIRGEEIVEVGIDSSFVCDEERKPHCKHCPFKDITDETK